MGKKYHQKSLPHPLGACVGKYFLLNLTNSKPKHYNSKIPNLTTELSVSIVQAASSAVSNLCTPETPSLRGVKSICNKHMYMRTILHLCNKLRFFCEIFAFFSAKLSHFFAKFSHLLFSENFAFLRETEWSEISPKKTKNFAFFASELNFFCETIFPLRWTLIDKKGIQL